MSLSIVQYYGQQSSKCGYCAGTNCSRSHGKNILKKQKQSALQSYHIHFILICMHGCVIQGCTHTVCPVKTTRN